MQDYGFLEWLNIAGFVVGILGLTAAYWQYAASREVCTPIYQVADYKIIGPFDVASPFTGSSDGKLSLLYEDKKITSASRTYVAFWNKGRRTMMREQILGELQLVLPEGCVVLGNPRVLKVTRTAISFNAYASTLESNVAEISFDFLDRGDGGLIEIIYAGEHQARPKMRGDFRGADQLKNRYKLILTVEKSAYDRAVSALSLGGFLFGIFTFGLSVILALGMLSLIVQWENPFGLLPSYILTELWVLGGAAWFAILQYFAANWPPVLNRSIRQLPRKLRTIPPPPSATPQVWRRIHLDVWRKMRARDLS